MRGPGEVVAVEGEGAGDAVGVHGGHGAGVVGRLPLAGVGGDEGSPFGEQTRAVVKQGECGDEGVGHLVALAWGEGEAVAGDRACGHHPELVQAVGNCAGRVTSSAGNVQGRNRDRVKGGGGPDEAEQDVGVEDDGHSPHPS